MKDRQLTEAELSALDPTGHSRRFRQVSTGYPHRVAQAYGGDLEAAAAASDVEVAEQVARWEREQRLPVRDWRAIGREERGGL